MKKYDVIYSFKTYESTSVVALYLNSIINDKDIFNHYSKIEVLALINELADHQWHNYKTMELDIRDRLEDWIIDNFNLQDFEIVDNLFLIIGSLGLTKVFSKLLNSSLDKNFSNQVRREVLEFSKEVNGNVSDPYSGVKYFE